MGARFLAGVLQKMCVCGVAGEVESNEIGLFVFVRAIFAGRSVKSDRYQRLAKGGYDQGGTKTHKRPSARAWPKCVCLKLPSNGCKSGCCSRCSTCQRLSKDIIVCWFRSWLIWSTPSLRIVCQRTETQAFTEKGRGNLITVLILVFTAVLIVVALNEVKTTNRKPMDLFESALL